LAAAVPHVSDLAGHIAGALQLTGVLGSDLADYLCSVATRIDYLTARGAGFHNDVGRHRSRCLFWLLVLDLAEVDFVMPHASVCLALAPGDLLVFDPTMAHGLCRPGDAGQAVAASFATGAPGRQVFLTGELLLSDAQWAGLGAPLATGVRPRAAGCSRPDGGRVRRAQRRRQVPACSERQHEAQHLPRRRADPLTARRGPWSGSRRRRMR
jgi:hypothetical protein